MRWLFLILLLSACCSSCFRRFVQSDKQLNEYYQQHERPRFRTIETDSFRLFCAVTGSDTLPPLLVIHGAPGAWYGSRNLLDDSLLKRRFQIIAVDRPGYNKSSLKRHKKTARQIDVQADDLFQALQLNHSNKKGIVMGSSYGGPIAARIAMNHPESFYHVVLLAGAIDPDHEKFWWFNKFVHHGPLKWMLPTFFRTATNEKYAHENELRKMLPRWSTLDVPVTFVQGDADNTVMPVNLAFAKRVMSGKQAEFILVPGGVHLIRWQHPELVQQILLQSYGASTGSHE
jgi:pimeloyl-ACP methyl ester carboxylesterase